jgi:hypothetical protein
MLGSTGEDSWKGQGRDRVSILRGSTWLQKVYQPVSSEPPRQPIQQTAIHSLLIPKIYGVLVYARHLVSILHVLICKILDTIQ